MKTKFLIIIGIVVAVSVSTIVVAEIYRGQIEWKEKVGGMTQGRCGEKYLEAGNGDCVLNPKLIEPHTIIIYDVTHDSGSRLSIAPHDLVVDLKDGNTITFVNNGLNTVNIFDKFQGLWSFENVKPSSQRELIINGTGYYEVLIQNSRHGETGRIVALSNDTNSLPVGIKAKMAQTIVGSDFGKGVGLISIGSGGAEPGITIGIHEKFKDDPDAEKFYYEKYRNMIPFDVPIWIEFTSPIVPQTG